MWKAAWDILPTKDKLARVVQSNDIEVWSCPLSNSKLETTEHLFLDCDIVRIIWRNSNSPINVAAFEDFHISSWVKVIIDPSKYLAIPKQEVRDFQYFAIIAMDKIWYTRNQVVHNSYQVDVSPC